jgi:hypothetical protein
MTLPAWPTTVDKSSLDTLADLIVKYKAADKRPNTANALP